MLCMVTKNVQFSFTNLLFRQTNGVEMGSPLGSTVADVFLGYYENSLLSTNQVKSSTYCCYVDNVFAFFNPKKMSNFFYKTYWYKMLKFYP